MRDFKKVTKEEFDAFIKAYPRELEVRFVKVFPRKMTKPMYIKMLTYNDFTIADKFPESVVAKHDTWDDDYYIIEEVKDNVG